jgi:lysosomal Pro-X carboxypeptidase
MSSAPPLLAFLPLLLLLAAFSPATTAAAARSSNPTTRAPFPPLVPLHLQALKRQRASSWNWNGKLAAAADGTAGASNGTAAKPFTAHYFPQELDHFTFTPNASMLFYQKYLVNDTYWRRPGGKGGAAGPLFVYTGNEGDIEWFATNTGFMFDIAPKFGALLVFIEVHKIFFCLSGICRRAAYFCTQVITNRTLI